MTYRPGGSLPLRALARAIGSYDLITDSGTDAPRDDADSTSATAGDAACPEALRVKTRHCGRFDVVNAREIPVDRYRDGSRDAMSCGSLVVRALDAVRHPQEKLPRPKGLTPGYYHVIRARKTLNASGTKSPEASPPAERYPQGGVRSLVNSPDQRTCSWSEIIGIV